MDCNDQPLQFILCQEVPDDNDYDPVQGGVGLKVGVQSREGIRVVGP